MSLCDEDAHLEKLFEEIVPYIKGFTLDDIFNIGRADVKLLGETKRHSIILCLFFDEVVEPWIDRQTRLGPFTGYILPMKGRLLSTDAEEDVYRIHISKFLERERKNGNRSYDIVDLSCNDLSKNDLPYVEDIVCNVWENVDTLLLNGNIIYFYGEPSWREEELKAMNIIKRILGKVNCYLVLGGEPFHFLEPADTIEPFFAGLTEADIDKLIWLPRCLLKSHSLNNIMRMYPPWVRERAKDAHTSFYDNSHAVICLNTKANAPI